MNPGRDRWALLHEAIFPSPLWLAIEATVYADGDRYRVAGPGGFLSTVSPALLRPAANDD